MTDAGALAARLYRASIEMSQRGLVRAAQWAIDAAEGMDVPYTVEPLQPASPLVVRAKAYFEAQEYIRVVRLVDERPEADETARFIRHYARFLSGERTRENADDAEFPSSGPRSQNPHLMELLKELEKEQDPHLLYLKGVVLRHQKCETEAIDVLIESVNAYPYNWSAWQELLSCFSSMSDLQARLADLNESEIFQIFLVYAHQEFFQQEDRFADLMVSLQALFPSFLFLKVQQALTHFHNLNYEKCQEIFEEILKADPYRLEDLDLYSNLLYVTEQRDRLALVAQIAFRADKFRPESCCIVGNYYSLRGQHEKAVSYYQRALTVSRTYLAAWTLMGHEYLELKNTNSAIASYRTAVDINKRDFRAWYGLGQAYEVQETYIHAQFYYQQALALRPADSRMWVAIANCYEHMSEYDRAISAYKHALKLSEDDAFLNYKLGRVYYCLNDTAKAAQYMRNCIDGGEPGSEFVNMARLWLARQAMERNEWEAAHAEAAAIEEGSIEALEEARAIVRDATSRLGRRIT